MDPLRKAFCAGFKKEAGATRKAIIGLGGLSATGLGAGYGISRVVDNKIKEDSLREWKNAKETPSRFADTYLDVGSKTLGKDLAGIPGNKVMLGLRRVGEVTGIGPPVTDNSSIHYKKFSEGPLSARKRIATEIEQGLHPDFKEPKRAYKDYKKSKDNVEEDAKRLEKDLVNLANRELDKNYKSIEDIPSHLQKKIHDKVSNDPQALSPDGREAKRNIDKWLMKIYEPAHDEYTNKIVDPLSKLKGLTQ